MEDMKTLSMKINYADTLNYAMFENRIPFIRNVILNNAKEEDLKNITLIISFQDNFAKEIKKEISILPKGTDVDLGKFTVEIDGEMLFGLTEAITLTMKVIIQSHEEILLEEKYEIKVLAYNEWQGYDTMPEMLAAFVTPNHPSIDNILIEASGILKDSLKDPSFEGYQQKDINRVREEVSAIYTALRNQAITYIGPPQSFNGKGQRIRLSSEVLEKKMGTCLDTTVLFASCLEAISINPVIILIEGHSFVGFWQEEEFFQDMVEYDIASITKRTAMGMNLIGVLETTDIRNGQTVPFLDAEKHALEHLTRPESFILALDVKRARASGIKPIPERILEGGSYIKVRDKNLEERAKDMPELISIVKLDLKDEGTKYNKKMQWERKLLDLSLRNNLLNFSREKKGIELLVKDSRVLEDRIYSGDEYEILSKITDHEGKDLEISLNSANDYLIEYSSLIEGEVAQKKIRTLSTEKELSTKMTKMYRDAKIHIEESGTNCLFLSLGLLKWYENDYTEKERYAPILLVPVELSKKIGKFAYKIKGREEETLINVTLLEKLKQDFGIEIKGLDPVPIDENGVDVIKVYSIIRNAIIDQKKWDVLESTNLGIFSFSKFIMWNDIKNHGDDLGKNKVISSLMEGRLTFVPNEMDDANRLLDEAIDPKDIILPVSTDASQMLAVEAAKKGNSFVLHGPPGTGKSQTITTIIANALYDDKRVLFVAEKMAALSVVQRRLEDLGLGHFSLEVHSNKSKKTAILKKLDETIKLSSSNNINFKEEADRLKAVRKELNSVVSTLYKKYGFGLCAYELIGILGTLKDTKEMSPLKEIDYETLTREELENVCLLGRELASVTKETGDYANTPLKGIGLKAYSFTIKGEAEPLLDSLRPKTLVLGDKLEEVQKNLGLMEIDTRNKEEALFRLLALLKESSTPFEVLFSSRSELISAMEDLVLRINERNEKKNAILSKFDEKILTVDPTIIKAEFKEADTKFILLKNMAQKKILKNLLPYAKNGMNKEEILPLMDHLETLKSLEAGIVKELQAQPELKSIDQGADTRIDVLQQAKTELTEAQRLLGSFDETDRTVLSAKIKNKEALQNVYSEELKALRDDFYALFNSLKEMLNLEVDELKNLEGNWYYRLGDRLDTYRNNLEDLREWTNYNNLKDKAALAKASELIEDFEIGTLDSRFAEDILRKAISKGAFAHILKHEEMLNKVTGRQIEDKIEYFKEVNKKYEELSKREIFYHLASKVPNMMKEANSSSEVGILQRAIRGNGRGTTIRSLFEKLPNLLPRIVPCMLMSPLSVAQYLGTNKEYFDLVIFDEASQLPTAEAVGAMARGKEVVIVGDPKQLPPTSFFNAVAAETEDEDLAFDDLDNILEDALALSMPETSLLWHYRSRHESLIAFSNKTYYDNNLYTYPSPKEMTSKVMYEFVEATYGRGGTRANKKEADAVVREIMERLKDKDRQNDSIGVVTFSQAQKDLVEDTLAEALKEFPEIEERILSMEEPLFVKNLENVQGDERDVILFSIGYGPDENGKLTLNFGPLNRDNGWKRLNVAITRSKKEMKIFTSVKPEMIDNARTSSKGLLDLKEFLEYARRGRMAIDFKEAEVRSKKDTLSHVIQKELEDRGFKVDTNIGSSKYKVDLGVVDPRNQDEYLLGILCQGESYNSARSARDRDILQESMLKGLGWNLHHVYPMDWVENKEKEIERIVNHVKEILAGESLGETVKPEGKSSFGNISFKQEIEGLQGKVETTEGIGKNYEEAQFQLKSMSSEEFRMPKNTRLIKDVLEEIIRVEAPISVSLLTKKVLKAFGIRNTVKNQEIIDNIFSSLSYGMLEENGTLFVYNEGGPKAIIKYRLNSPDCRRDAADIPDIELELAIRDIVLKQVSIPKESLLDEVQKLFNFSKTNGEIRERVKNILDTKIIDGAGVDENGNYISR